MESWSDLYLSFFSLFSRQVLNQADGTYTMRWVYYGGLAWIGVGITEGGAGWMFPANAVIGRIDENGNPSVLRYSMTTDAEDASGGKQHRMLS